MAPLTLSTVTACPRAPVRPPKPLGHAGSGQSKGQVVLLQWLARTPAPGVDLDESLDVVAYSATQLGETLCCDMTLASALTRDKLVLHSPSPSAQMGSAGT